MKTLIQMKLIVLLFSVDFLTSLFLYHYANNYVTFFKNNLCEI